MVNVQHARHSIKSEAIELILIHPEAEITEKETHNLVVTVIEQSAIPLVVASLASRVEVLMVCAVELIDTIQHVLGGVAVDDIEEHNNTQAVSSVDELLEILWGTISTACSVKVVDLVTKTSVVGVLHDGHELNHVVAEMLDTRQHVLGELFVSRHAFLGCGDANMGLIHTSTCRLLGSGMLELILFCWWRVPEVCVIRGRD